MHKDAHRQCQFGQWYYQYTSPHLRRLPAFVSIENEHAGMHELAARLLVTTSTGKPISPYDYDGFAQALERMRLQVHSLKRELDGHLPVEASLDRADKALYAAKAAGRNCVRVWSPDL